MEYKCPWCGSSDTSRYTHSYVNHFLKGTLIVGGNLALYLLTQGRGFVAQQGGNAAGNGLTEFSNHGCYDYKCNNCEKDFFVYFDNRKGEKTEARRYQKDS